MIFSFAFDDIFCILCIYFNCLEPLLHLNWYLINIYNLMVNFSKEIWAIVLCATLQRRIMNRKTIMYLKKNKNLAQTLNGNCRFLWKYLEMGDHIIEGFQSNYSSNINSNIIYVKSTISQNIFVFLSRSNRSSSIMARVWISSIGK